VLPKFYCIDFLHQHPISAKQRKTN